VLTVLLTIGLHALGLSLALVLVLVPVCARQLVQFPGEVEWDLPPSFST
jgi:hypothetical protein